MYGFALVSQQTSGRKIAETEEREYLMHSRQECSDIVFCKGPVYARHRLASICIIKRQTGLHLQLCNTNTVSECSQQRGRIPGAQSWFSTFSNSFFPADYFCSTTEWKGHVWGIHVLWRPHSLSAAATGCSNFCYGTGLAHRALRSGLCLLGLDSVLLLSHSWESRSWCLPQDAVQDCAYWREVNLCVWLCLQIMSKVHV